MDVDTHPGSSPLRNHHHPPQTHAHAVATCKTSLLQNFPAGEARAIWRSAMKHSPIYLPTWIQIQAYPLCDTDYLPPGSSTFVTMPSPVLYSPADSPQTPALSSVHRYEHRVERFVLRYPAALMQRHHLCPRSCRSSVPDNTKPSTRS